MYCADMLTRLKTSGMMVRARSHLYHLFTAVPVPAVIGRSVLYGIGEPTRFVRPSARSLPPLDVRTCAWAPVRRPGVTLTVSR